VLIATLSGGKLALMGIPNIEIVTLLIIIYSVVFGLRISIPSIFIFVLIEMLLWGLNSWVILYFFYFPMLGIGASFLYKILKKFHAENNPVFFAIFAGVMSFLFGILSTTIDTFIYTSDNYMKMWIALYTSGITFFLTHIISNTIILSVAYYPLKRAGDLANHNNFREETI